MDAELGKAAIRYIGLFRPAKSQLSWSRTAKLLNELMPSITPELEMVLEHYDGRVFDVVFRLHEGLFADLEPVRFATPETGTERYTATIRLMTV